VKIKPQTQFHASGDIFAPFPVEAGLAPADSAQRPIHFVQAWFHKDLTADLNGGMAERASLALLFSSE
jgi:hypothetical protein